MKLNMHVPSPFIVILLILSLPLLMILIAPISLADVNSQAHTSNCYNCHVVDYPTDSDEGALHEMTSAVAWSNCGDANCHGPLETSLLSSVHAQVSCRGCHSPLHVSLNTAGTGAWLFVSRLNNSGEIAYKPTLPLSFNETVYYYDNTNDTLLLGDSVSGWGGEIHWAWTNVSGSAAGITGGTRYLVCMNCHFLTTNPAEAGLMKSIGGHTMIGIPEFTLRMSPHTVSDSTLKEAANSYREYLEYESEYVSIGTGLISGIGIIGLIIWRKRN
jgi:hypothetical protein